MAHARTFYKASIADTIAISKELEAHCKTIEGKAVYEKEWDDSRIAQVIGGQISHSHVSNIRRQLYGNLIVGALKHEKSVDQFTIHKLLWLETCVKIIAADLGITLPDM